GFAAMMSYISASPFVGQTILGIGQVPYALSFTAAASAIIFANLLNSQLAVRLGVSKMFAAGSFLLVCAAVSFVVIELTDTLSVPGFIASSVIRTAGAGLTVSSADALGLAEATPAARWAGAAVMGAVQLLVASLARPLVGLGGEASATPMGV